MEIEVKHNEKEHRFECVKEGQLAYVEYKKIPDGMDFIATFVPEELRGKGKSVLLWQKRLCVMLKANG